MATDKIQIKIEGTVIVGGKVVVAGEELTVNAKIADNLVERNLATVVGEAETEDEHVDDELDDMTVDELKEYADEAGVDLKGVTKKADIIATIREAI